jgi:hypothetical protein
MLGVGLLTLRVRIEWFRSIESVEFELGDLTVLLGPPAAGKSNILDALGVAGYLHRFRLLDREYGNNAANLEPLTLIARFNEIPQLFRYGDIGRPIRVKISGDIALSYEISFVSGSPRVVVNEKPLPWDLRTLRPDPMGELQNVVKQLQAFETRLYGFDRYGLASGVCMGPHPCGLHLRLSAISNARGTPVSLLSELGWNAPFITRRHQSVVRDINDVLRGYVGERVEVKLRRSGEVLVFDYDAEVDAVGVSESIYRTLYSLLALKSSQYYVKTYGLEKKYVALLEEPEAHVFPFFLDLIANAVRDAVNDMYVLVTTHNPLFASLLADRVKNVKVLYVYRCLGGSTCVREVDVSRMAEDLVGFEDILLKPPSEVLEKYVVSPKEVKS